MGPKKPVYRISDDGTRKLYASVAEATKDTSKPGNHTLISRAAKTGLRHAGYRWSYVQEVVFDHNKKIPAVLLLDVETLPMVALVWGLFKPSLGYQNIIKDWCVLSWSAKWLHRPDVYSDVLTPDEALKRDDSRICKSVFEMLEMADVVIAHNAKKFDIRKINSRLFTNRMRRPSPYQVIDTLEHSRKLFAHSSHRLDYLGMMIFRRQKLETNFDLWVMCHNGEPEALEYMDKYCKQDIFLLEEVYIEMRGWMNSHPNLAVFADADEPVCPTCTSLELESCGEYATPANTYHSFRCKNCGAVGRLRQSSLTPKQRDRLRLSVAR